MRPVTERRHRAAQAQVFARKDDQNPEHQDAVAQDLNHELGEEVGE